MQDHDLGLRMYEGDELRFAIEELFSYESFLDGMKTFLPEQLYTWILGTVTNIETVFDFQKNIIHPFLKLVEGLTIRQLSSEGLENLDPNERYLFISNHRDIGLDSAYLNMLLFENDMPTSQIAIGDNLMKHRISELIFRINKSFVVKRSGNARELYDHAVKLSNYIWGQIFNLEDSVWIAQREGRAKDGNDRTQISVLKMLSLSRGEKSLVEHFKQLNVVPVAISYEFDPCGILKTQEFLKKKENPNYKKSFQDDVESILYGIKGEKGRVHLSFGKPLFEELDQLESCQNTKAQFAKLASIIDEAIHRGYQLYPVNYVAYDLIHHTNRYSTQYSVDEYVKYKTFFEQQIKQLKGDQEAGRNFLLKSYAFPLINKEALQ